MRFGASATRTRMKFAAVGKRSRLRHAQQRDPRPRLGFQYPHRRAKARRADRRSRRTVFIYLAITHLGGAGTWVPAGASEDWMKASTCSRVTMP